jgi:hypothetical protein
MGRWTQRFFNTPPMHCCQGFFRPSPSGARSSRRDCGRRSSSPPSTVPEGKRRIRKDCHCHGEGLDRLHSCPHYGVLGSALPACCGIGSRTTNR